MVLPSDEGIAGPGGPQMLRSIRLMRRDPPAFLAQCTKRYGPIVSFPIPGSSVLYLADPHDVRQVLQTDHTAYSKHTVQYDSLALVTGRGLLASDGPHWLQRRRLVQPAFHSALVNTMAGAVHDTTRKLVERWHAANATTAETALTNTWDIDREMLQLTLGVVEATLFGATHATGTTSLIEGVLTAMQVVVAKAQIPIPVPDWLPTPTNRRLARSLRQLDVSVQLLIATRRTQPRGTDVLWLLLQAADSGEITPQGLRDEIVTLIVAGHETVAATLTWTWWLLSTAPAAEAALHEEVDRLPAGSWGASVVEQLPYTRAVVNECLRLYPAAWVVTRRSRRPVVLGGHDVPAGATLIISPYLLHRDGHLWREASTFRPDRFLAAADVERLGYLPFGAGPRLCIGRDLALLQLPIIVAEIARSFRVLPVGGQPRPDFGVTLRPRNGLPCRLLARY